MSLAEKWVWHTDVYAFRYVVLGKDDRTSPPDPDGIWYDAGMVEAAIIRKRQQIAHQRRQYDAQAIGRETRIYEPAARAREELARQSGYDSFEQMRVMGGNVPRAPKAWNPEELRVARVALGMENPPPAKPDDGQFPE